MVIFGHGKSYLVALVAGPADRTRIASAIGKLNKTQPHYRQIRAWHIEEQPLTIESGLLTANGKPAAAPPSAPISRRSDRRAVYRHEPM